MVDVRRVSASHRNEVERIAPADQAADGRGREMRRAQQS